MCCMYRSVINIYNTMLYYILDNTITIYIYKKQIYNLNYKILYIMCIKLYNLIIFLISKFSYYIIIYIF